MSNAAKSYEPGADQAIERAAAGERVVVRREGAEVVAVVPLEDLRRLEELEAEEDRIDAEIAERRLADVRAGREQTVPFDQVLTELGLSRADLSD
jgi:prevent-host-death family protein